MKKLVLVIASICVVLTAAAQKVEDLFKRSDVLVTWLGLDFSHAKMIGDFTQFKEAGGQSASDIRNRFFPAWNNVIIHEQKKYDIGAMLRKEDIVYDIDMIMKINASTSLESIESNFTPNYKNEDIAGFVKTYNTGDKKGIGVLFLVECFNKNAEKAIIHFVAINMTTKEVLLHERLSGKPKGFGLRNFWAGSIFNVINDIRDDYYKTWKGQHGKK